jgi:hypothetical protein
MPHYNVEAELWSLVHWLEPSLWTVRALAAAAVFFLLFFQPWKVSRVALFFRYMSMIGAIVVGCSIVNRPLGPLGDLIFWPSYMAYQAVMVYKMLPALLAQKRVGPAFPETTVLRYAFTRRLPHPSSTYGPFQRRDAA